MLPACTLLTVLLLLSMLLWQTRWQHHYLMRDVNNNGNSTQHEETEQKESTRSITITNKPILFLHGVGGHASEFDDIIQFVHQKYGQQAPPMHSINICDGSCSLLTPMTQQRDDMIAYLQSNANQLGITDQGFHWVTHSQGALLARSVIQALAHENNNNNNNRSTLQVDTYISMAGPQMGQWGECTMNRTDIPEAVAKKMTRRYGWIFFYNSLAQNELSFANYWHDPRHMARMIEEAILLPALNGYDRLQDMRQAKENFLRLGKAVFLGSEDDDCINPPLSSVFSFVYPNGTVQPMMSSLEYRNDTFGLRTMKRQGRLIVRNCRGLDHLSWRKPQVFEKYVLPHLLIDTRQSTLEAY